MLNSLIYDLKTLGEVKKYDKINANKEHIVIMLPSMLQGFWRWYDADNRDKAISKIDNIVKMTVEISSRILESRHIEAETEDPDRIARIKDLQRIYTALSVALPGIKILRDTTYEDDADAKFRFDCIVKLCDAELIKLKSILFIPNYITHGI